MLIVKTGTNETKKISEIFVKTGSVLKEVAEGYAVYLDENGNKQLGMVFCAVVAPILTTDNFASSASYDIKLINITKNHPDDTLEFMYTEYGTYTTGGQKHVATSGWTTSSTYNREYSCSSFVYIEVRSKRNGIYSTNTSIYKYELKSRSCGEYGNGDYCSICGTELGHECSFSGTYKVNIVEATCTEPGSYDIKCDYCDAIDPNGSYTLEIDPDNHTNIQQMDGQEATCGEAGWYDYEYCADCNEYSTYEDIPATGDHNFVDGVCTGCGEPDPDEYRCSHSSTAVCGGCLSCYANCNGEYTESTATCTEGGARLCTECGADHGWDEALGHDYTKTVTNPTCTEKGYTTYTCSCGDSYIDNWVDKLGHAWGAWATQQEATCTEAGYKNRGCENPGCGEVEEEDIAALGHEWYEYEKCEATCVEDGYVIKKCAHPDCDEDKQDVLSATGKHSWDYTKYECSICSAPLLVTCDECGGRAQPQVLGDEVYCGLCAALIG